MSFTLLSSSKNDFISGALVHYVHDASGCEIIHARNDDRENAFVFCVPTHPENSRGVAHILEHTVLCGSRLYRTKSPFQQLFQGSCKTYLNAVTYPDRTLYPGASAVEEDALNLFRVYADAVWCPLLGEAYFRQEGFHFSGIEKNVVGPGGIVYNEMKGAYSDRDEILADAMYHHLFPDVAYRFDSGGDPREIPNLSYEQFCAFHRRWYRPALTKVLLYGNIPTERFLDVLTEPLEARLAMDAQDAPAERVQRGRLILPQSQAACILKTTLHADVPLVPGQEHQHSADVGWLLHIPASDTIARMSASFLHAVLMDIPGSPLRKMLLESGLGEDVSNLSGYDGTLYQATYSAGLLGVKEADVPRVEPFILDSLSHVCRDGFSNDVLDAAMQRVEFQVKESLVTTGSKINWLSSLGKAWLYGCDVRVTAEPLPQVEKLKSLLSDARYLSDFLHTHLVANEHRVTVLSRPEAAYEARMASEEAARIASLWNAQSEMQKTYWRDMERSITEISETPDDPKDAAAIPMLKAADLPRAVEVWPESRQFLGGAAGVASAAALLPEGVQWVDIEDNGIIYAWLHFDVTDLISRESAGTPTGRAAGLSLGDEASARFLLPTLSACFTDLGTTACGYEELALRIRRETGKLDAVVDNLCTLDGGIKVFVSVEIRALREKFAKALDLAAHLCTSVDYANTKRLAQIVNEGKTSIRSRVIQQGTSFAALKAASRYSELPSVDDDHNGLSQLAYLQRRSSSVNNMGADLSSLAKKVYAANRLSCTVVAGKAHAAAVCETLSRTLEALPHDEGYRADARYESDKKNIGRGVTRSAFFVPTQVAFNACIIPCVRYTHEQYAAFDMASRLVSSSLWDSIRMQEGAYGAGCSISGSDGLMEFYTYRDPNIEKSFNLFFQSLRAVADGTFSSDELEKLRIGMLGEALAPASPHKKGVASYRRSVSGIDAALRQKIRDGAFALSREDVMAAAAQCVQWSQDASFASFCGKNAGLAQQWTWESTEDIGAQLPSDFSAGDADEEMADDAGE